MSARLAKRALATTINVCLIPIGHTISAIRGDTSSVFTDPLDTVLRDKARFPNLTWITCTTAINVCLILIEEPI